MRILASLLPLMTASMAWGVYPIWSAPGYSSGSGGYNVNASADGPIVYRRARVSDAGISVGEVDKFDAAGNALGVVAVRWRPSVGSGIELGGVTPDPISHAYNSRVWGMNASGTAVGSGDASVSAVRWEPASSAAAPLPMPPGSSGTYSDAFDINASGVIVGQVDLMPVVWASATSTPTTLAVPIGQFSASANAVNASGVVVGEASGAIPGEQAVRWSAGTHTLTTLATPAPPAGFNASSRAFEVAADGSAFGQVFFDQPSASRFVEYVARWDAVGSGFTLLGSLGTDANGDSVTSLSGINARGAAVGYGDRYDAGHARRGVGAIRWAAGATTATELGRLGTALDGSTLSRASAINDLNVAVGFAHVYDSLHKDLGPHAVLWNAAGTAVDLNGYVNSTRWTLLSAVGVSNTGFITGVGAYDPDGLAGPAEGYATLFTLLVPQAGTYGLGDANFDERIDFGDLLILARHYGQTNSGDVNAGDFDLNGVTNFSDLLTLARNYGTSPTALMSAPDNAAFANDWALAQSLVPEPTAIAGLLLVASVGTRRRAR